MKATPKSKKHMARATSLALSRMAEAQEKSPKSRLKSSQKFKPTNR